ncbi:MAG TPA: rhomboid family intramembrane serine protease [Bacillales bacterium]|nr:rhomboid family intramembrane serine protease [Bacillales bacterium]
MPTINSQDYLYWRLVYELVTKHRFRIINLYDHGEVWLQRIEWREKNILRLVRDDINWGNYLVRDMANVTKAIDLYKQQTYSKKVDFYNIFVSTYSPVDDWEYQVDNRNNVEIVLIEQANQEQEIERLFKLLNLPSPDVKSWFSDMEDPPILINRLRQTEKDRKKAENDLLFAKKPFFTYILVAINLIMFLLLELVGSGSTDLSTLIKFGAKYNPAILEGDWWRFITPMFLHIGFLHLAMNSLALYYLGISVERIYGSWRFLTIYFAAGITGGVASFVFTTQVSAGASGAIFGCFGALLYFGVAHPSLFLRSMGWNVIVVLGINLAFGFLVPMVDNSAHIGGLIGGFLASAIVHLPNHKNSLRQAIAFLLFSVIMGAALVYGFYYSDQKEDPLVVGQLSQQLIEDGDYEKANQLLSEVVQTNGEVPPEILFLLSYTEIKLGQNEKAITLLETVVEEKSDFHEAYYNLALLYLDKGDYEKAKVAINKALEIRPYEGDYKSLVTEIEKFNFIQQKSPTSISGEIITN